MQDLLNFLDYSVTSFHAVDQSAKILSDAGYIKLEESGKWHLNKGGKYYVVRNDSSIIAFNISDKLDNYHYQISASHSDSPSFKVKEAPTLKGKHYLQLNVEGYGGMINSTWFDRPLSLAGRVIYQNGDKLEKRLINIDKDSLIIPNVAIHMNRDTNNGFKMNHQIDLLPLMGVDAKEDAYMELIASKVNVNKEDILGSDIYLYNRTKASVWGVDDEFLSSGRLDNLLSLYTTLKGFVEVDNPNGINVLACFDNEEVGSGSMCGALSTFLYDCLQRINDCLGFSNDDYYQAIAKSFMISQDCSHAIHPNHPEKSDAKNYPVLNGGVAIKYNANQKYLSNAVSGAVFKNLCHNANQKYQLYANRSDMPGGSTLGNLSARHVSLHGVDIGLPMLAMHSSYETTGSQDIHGMIEIMKYFYSHEVVVSDDLIEIK